MAWARAQSPTGSTSTTPVTAQAATLAGVTAGNLLVVGVTVTVGDNTATTITVADNHGNTYASAIARQYQSFTAQKDQIAIFWLIAPTSASYTITASPSPGCYTSVCINEYSFTVGTISLDATGGNDILVGNGTTAVSTSAALTLTGTDLIFALCSTEATGATATFTAGTSFTLGFDVTDASSSILLGSEDWLNNSGATVTPSISIATTSTGAGSAPRCAIVAVAFKTQGLANQSLPYPNEVAWPVKPVAAGFVY